MDVQTGLVYVAVVFISAVVVGLVSMFAMKEKSYEEAIAEQRKLPDDLLLGVGSGKKEKNKEKKFKNKTGKKFKEKKEEKEEKEEKVEHVQFEEVPQVLQPESVLQDNIGKLPKKKPKVDKVKPILVNKDEIGSIIEIDSEQTNLLPEINHFELIQPKDEFELIKSQSRENLNQISQVDGVANKSPKDTPTKVKKNIKEKNSKKKDELLKEEKKELNAVSKENFKEQAKDAVREAKEIKESKEFVKEVSSALFAGSNKDTKKIKKKNDILTQIGGDKDGVNVSLLMPLVQKAELSRSEIQLLIEQLLNKQQDNPNEYAEWTESRADPVIKLKKQVSELEKSLCDEHEACVALQNKLKELRTELNSERFRSTGIIRQHEENINIKGTEIQTLHTRMQHILESHNAEKQGFSRQIEQLQAKINDNAAIIHKMQDQGQTHGQLQQELVNQRKQMDLQFSQMRENENALKAQLAQKHVEIQELQNVNMTMSQELQATIESSTQEIEILRGQISIMQEQLLHSEAEARHFREASERYQNLHLQLEESQMAQSDMENTIKTMIRNEQDLKKKISSLKSELETVRNEAEEVISLRLELKQVQSEFTKLKANKSVTDLDVNEEQEVSRDDEYQKAISELNSLRAELKKSRLDVKKLETDLKESQNELKLNKLELSKTQDNLNLTQNDLIKCQEELREVQQILAQTRAEFSKLQGTPNTIKDQKISELQIETKRLKEEKERLCLQLSAVVELQKELKQLHELNESLTSQLAASKQKSKAEGQENGIEETVPVSKSQHTETEIMEKEEQSSALRQELTKKDKELQHLSSQIEKVKEDFMNQLKMVQQLQSSLEEQKTKNNELRRRNWKVMEALTSAENLVKSSTMSNEALEKKDTDKQKSIQIFLQNIFPEIEVSAKSHEEWMEIFEKKLRSKFSESKVESGTTITELEKENKSLQGMVTYFKKIIDETEGMLNNLQNHVEAKEQHWQAQLRQQENENSNLRIEMNELRVKLKSETEGSLEQN